MSKAIDYGIENVGGIDHVTLRLLPGVNVLRGRNAAGKTTAIRAVTRAQGGKALVEKRDGTELGTVTGPGVTLRVRQVVTTTGDAGVELADVGPLARLIDPGMKSTDAAARERVRALIELLELSVDDSHLERLCKGEPELLGWLRSRVNEESIDDLMVAAESLRSRAHSLAREQEDVATNARGQADAAEINRASLLAELGGDEAKASVSEMNAALDDAIRQHERAVARCEAREELEARQRSIRATLSDPPDVNSLAEIAVATERSWDRACVEVAELRERLVAAEATVAIRAERLSAAQKELEAAREAAATHAKQRAILDQTVDGPTREDVAALKRRTAEARVALDAAIISENYRLAGEKVAEAERVEEQASARAVDYRALASGIPARLGEILASAGAPGLTVIGGRLHAIRGDERKDYEHRCSTGERVALALDVAATAYRGKVLPLDGAFWGALDPEHRAAFVRMARERDLYVITEEPADGELRAEAEP